MTKSRLIRLDTRSRCVVGLALLDETLYVACKNHNSLLSYDSTNCKRIYLDIRVPLLKSPGDMVACQTGNGSCLYVFDICLGFVFRVDDKSASRFGTVRVSRPGLLSVTADGLLPLVTDQGSVALCKCSGEILAYIWMPAKGINICHCVEMHRHHFLVCQGKPLSLCEISDGCIVRDFSFLISDRNVYLASSEAGNVICSQQQGILRLTSGELHIDKELKDILHPTRICCLSDKRLFIGTESCAFIVDKSAEKVNFVFFNVL